MKKGQPTRIRYGDDLRSCPGTLTERRPARPDQSTRRPTKANSHFGVPGAMLDLPPGGKPRRLDSAKHRQVQETNLVVTDPGDDSAQRIWRRPTSAHSPARGRRAISVFYGLPSFPLRVNGQRLVASRSAVLSHCRDLLRRGSSPGLVGGSG